MKKLIYTFAALFFSSIIIAQAPQSFSYQAVVRNADGSLIENTMVGMKISILAGSETGTPVCVEEFTPTTNDHGLVTLQIGSSNTTDFQSIDWSYQDYFVKIELDPAGGTSYSEMGTSQLLSVPYALHAKSAGENLYFKDNKVGIGYNNPSRLLTLDSESESCYIIFQTDNTGNNGNDGFLSGMSITSNNAYLWNYEEGDIRFGTHNSQQMAITEDGDVGIGTINPGAKLDVKGSTKLGNSGVVFQELREFTGTTHATNNYVSVTLPSGYSEENTRVLSLEINYANSRWVGTATDNGSASYNSVSYYLDGTKLYIYYPDITSYKARKFRVLFMKMAD
jgi:hypothetical protein